MIASKRFPFLFALVFAALIYIAPSRAAGEVAGDLIHFNSDGGWSWFEGEQAAVDSVHGKILVSSVANGHGPGGKHRAGDIDIVSYGMTTRRTQRFTLCCKLQEDDHDSASLLILPN